MLRVVRLDMVPVDTVPREPADAADGVLTGLLPDDAALGGCAAIPQTLQ